MWKSIAVPRGVRSKDEGVRLNTLTVSGTGRRSVLLRIGTVLRARLNWSRRDRVDVLIDQDAGCVRVERRNDAPWAMFGNEMLQTTFRPSEDTISLLTNGGEYIPTGIQIVGDGIEFALPKQEGE